MEVDHEHQRRGRLRYLKGGARDVAHSQGVGRGCSSSTQAAHAQQFSGVNQQGLDATKEEFSLSSCPRYYRSLGQLHGVVGGSAFWVGWVGASLAGMSTPVPLLGAVIFAATTAALCFICTVGRSGLRWRAFNPDAGYTRGAVVGVGQGVIPLVFASTFWSTCTAAAAVTLFGVYATLRLIESKRSLRCVVREVGPQKGA